MNPGWVQHRHKLTKAAKAKRKSKRNRAWKAIHRAAKRNEAKQKIAQQVADFIQDLGASELDVKAEKPNFLQSLSFEAKK